MKPKLNTWTPITCDCTVIEYTDENGIMRFVTHEEAVALHEQIFKDYPDSTISPKKFPQPKTDICPFHSSIGEKKELYDVMLDEGKRCMGVKRILLGDENFPAVRAITEKVSEVKRENGSDFKDFREGVEYKWEFEGTGKDRVLKVRVDGANLSQAEKKQIKDLTDEKFGVGRVEVE